MLNRLKLRDELSAICPNLYFQPPSTVKMKYPCIVYSLDNEWTLHADDSLYQRKDRYSLTIIDKNPDSEIPELIRRLRYTSFERSFTADNLNHFVFNIYR